MTSTDLQVTCNVCRHELFQELNKFGGTKVMSGMSHWKSCDYII